MQNQAASRDEGPNVCIGRIAANWLHLAAAPTFASMALLTGVLGGGPLEVLCSASPLSGMVPMYALMSAFHLAPWLRLLPHRS